VRRLSLGCASLRHSELDSESNSNCITTRFQVKLGMTKWKALCEEIELGVYQPPSF